MHARRSQAVRPASRALRVGTDSTMRLRMGWLCAGSKFALLLGAVMLLGALPFAAQTRTVSATLLLQIRPEELLQIQGGNVALKIRLARGATARVWAASSCASPLPEAQLIPASGTYTIPLSSLKPVAGASQVCLASTDGVLNDARPAEIPGTGNGGEAVSPRFASGGVLVDLPDGWAVSSRGGITTWSNP